MRTNGNRSVPLQKRRGATGKGGAGSEMMGGQIGRCPARIHPVSQIRIRWRGGLEKLPDAKGDEGKRRAVLIGQLKAAGFQRALAAVIVTMGGSVTVVMLGLAIARQQPRAGPQAMRGGRQPSRQYHQCRHEPKSFH